MASTASSSSSEPTNLYEAFFWIEPSAAKDAKDAGTFAGTKVLWHHPDDVSNVIKSFRNIPQFCFPDLENIKVENVNSKTKTMRRNEHFTFTLQEQNGNRVYGICFRSLFTGVLGRFDTPRRARHCLCFITRNPLFHLFRVILMQVHALCLLSKDLLRARHFLDIISSQANQCLANLQMSTLIYCQISKNVYPGIPHDIIISSPRKSGLRLSSKEVSVLPLLELLGTEKLLTLLGAVLCERRVLFIANDVEIISNSVLAIASLIDPFSWQHVFIPLLPGKLLDYASAPMPYLIGVRKYWYDKIPSDALGDVLVVDVDTGDMRTFGTDVLKNTDFVGESANTLNQVTESLDRAFAKASNLFGMLTKSDHEESGPRDIVAFIVSEIKAILSSKPGTNVISSVATGLLQSHHSREEMLIQWAAESEKSLRDTIMYFFVYLFAIFDDYVVKPGSKPNSERGVAAKGEEFGKGDSRANFNINGFKSRRRQLGDSADLLTFLNELMHSQIFEQFCDEQIKKRDIIQQPAVNTEVEVFDLACKKLRTSRQPITVSSAKAVVTECSRGEGFDKMGFEFHNLTYQFTEPKDNQPASQVQAILDRICLEGYHSNNMFRILRTIKIRLDSSVASQGRGRSGEAGVRALMLLKVILVSGPVAATTYAIDFIPQIRMLIKNDKKKNGEGGEKVGKKGGKVNDVLDFMTEKDFSVDLTIRARAVLELLVDSKTLMVQRRFAYLKQFTKESEKSSLINSTGSNSKGSSLITADSLFESSSSKQQVKQELMTTINVGGGQCNRSFPAFSSIHRKLQAEGCIKFEGTLILKQPVSSEDDNEFYDDDESDESGMNSLPDAAKGGGDLRDDNSASAKYRIINKDTSEVLDLRVLDKMTPKGPSVDRKPNPNVPILSPPPPPLANIPKLSKPPSATSQTGGKSSSTNTTNTNTNTVLNKKPPAVDPFFNDNSADSWEVDTKAKVIPPKLATAATTGTTPSTAAATKTASSFSSSKIIDPFASTTDPFISQPPTFPTSSSQSSSASKPANSNGNGSSNININKPPATLLDDVFDLTMPAPLPLARSSNGLPSSPTGLSIPNLARSNVAPVNPFDGIPGFNNNFNTNTLSNSSSNSSSSINSTNNSQKPNPLGSPSSTFAVGPSLHQHQHQHQVAAAAPKDPFADLMFLDQKPAK